MNFAAYDHDIIQKYMDEYEDNLFSLIADGITEDQYITIRIEQDRVEPTESYKQAMRQQMIQLQLDRERVKQFEEQQRQKDLQLKVKDQERWELFMHQISSGVVSAHGAASAHVDVEKNITCNGEVLPLRKPFQEIKQNWTQAFHATSLTNVPLILENGFQCGQIGTQGAGIYFCPRPIDCIKKVVQPYIGKQTLARYENDPPIILFDVDLYMGNPYVITSNSEETRPIDEMDVYDSVIFLRDTGVEFIVYRPLQVEIRNIYRIDWTILEEFTIQRLQEQTLRLSREQSFQYMNQFLDQRFNKTPILDRTIGMPYYLFIDDTTKNKVTLGDFSGKKRYKIKSKTKNRKQKSNDKK